MRVSSQSLLLFALNWLDAQLTLLWVRAGLTTEGNGLMARLLDAGDLPFMGTKLLIGAFAAYVLYRWAHLPLAQRGLKFALGVYLLLMSVHAATGLSALGYRAPESVLVYLISLPEAFLALFV